MNILFLTTGEIESIEHHGIYPDLLRCFRDNGHNVYIVCSYERRLNKKTELLDDCGVIMLHVQIGNLTKTSIFEKGISTLLLEQQYTSAIKKYLSNTAFDLILYSTPPVTLEKVIRYVKKRDNCKSYLLLKDIFPQNAVDLQILKTNGIKGIIYRYFRYKEKSLYKVSDYVGCMSEANVKYLIDHNRIDPAIVEVCPNSIDAIDMSVSQKERTEIREKFNIPINKKVFIYGGNLGKPQGIDFMLECLERQKTNENVYFLIIGDGTEFKKIEGYINNNNSKNIKLMKRLPKEDYDRIVGACDVGLIFLDNRFTIPNFPSRILSYMQAKIPVLAITDPNTDIGTVIVNGGFGWWCESSDAEAVSKQILVIEKDATTTVLGENGWNYLLEHYTSRHSYQKIMRRIE